jgi:arginine N-succinyltransferase|tara:strand:+ start:16452 stop:17480 length:1029 start_codon:yes stop_codon:yes gene_type:complete
MIVIRPVEHEDIDGLYHLAQKAGPGMTTFPPDKKVLTQKIIASNKAFSDDYDKNTEGSFLMVLVDTQTNVIMGTAGIYSNIGKDTPFYSFKILTRSKHSYKLNSKVSSKTLHLVNEYTGDTEVGTLILDPDYRGGGYGKLLSKCRYLLIAQFRQLFGARLIAELRGWSDDNAISPFWESVGKHFFQGMQYEHADYLSATTNNQFISDLMPEYPIYIDLLPEMAKSVIGKPHQLGEPALNMLFKEGFHYENFVDIFDAGPTVHAYVENIETIKHSQEKLLSNTVFSEAEAVECLVCNASITDFRVCQAKVYFNDDGSVALAPEAFAALLIKFGQPLRVYPLEQ